MFQVREQGWEIREALSTCVSPILVLLTNEILKKLTERLSPWKKGEKPLVGKVLACEAPDTDGGKDDSICEQADAGKPGRHEGNTRKGE